MVRAISMVVAPDVVFVGASLRGTKPSLEGATPSITMSCVGSISCAGGGGGRFVSSMLLASCRERRLFWKMLVIQPIIIAGKARNIINIMASTIQAKTPNMSRMICQADGVFSMVKTSRKKSSADAIFG